LFLICTVLLSLIKGFADTGFGAGQVLALLVPPR
jgi:hypothetical protein